MLNFNGYFYALENIVVLRIVFFLFINIIVVISSYGQETTGSLIGYIKDFEGNGIEYATIKIIDANTNSTTGTISQKKGTFNIQNLLPSTYTMEVSFIGYATYTEENVKISLGQETIKNIILTPKKIAIDEVIITHSVEDDISGNGSRISQQQIEETPTIFRSIQELSRANPENNLNSFGGASHRFNNLNIDGVATNDVIGFQEPASGAAGTQANGTPGSLSKTQPIGLGAIKALSIKLTPFDVSIGNFNGANIDIITKSGTNKYEHSIFTYGNNQLTLGNYADGIKQQSNNFFDYQVGVNSGGPIKRDKIFYFVNVEFANGNFPLTSAPGSDNSNIALDDVLAVRDFLQKKYKYDPGNFESSFTSIQSSKIFSRIDFNLSDRNKLIIRNNYVKSFADNLEWNANFFNFGNQGFRHNSIANSTVIELKTNFSKFYNKLNVGFNVVKEGRDFDGRIFPHIQIASSSSSRIFAGTYREASVFNTKFNTLQITDKVSASFGNHFFSAGLQLQLHDIDYGFLSAWNGRWEYKSIEDFLNDRPTRIRGVYNVNPTNNNFNFVNNNPAATLGIFESAIFIQDKYRIADHTILNYGLRIDGQFLTQPLPISALLKETASFSNFNNELNNNFQFNPRISIRHKILDDKLSLNAGSGLFSGKLPYLWFAYFEYISGTEYFNIDFRPDDTFELNENLGELAAVQPGLTEINVLDPEFKYPRDWKTNFGFEYKVKSNIKFNIEFSYTKVLQGLLFKTANRTEEFSNFSGADNRPFYNGIQSKVNPNFTNVFVLTNTNQGYRYNLTLSSEMTEDKFYSYVAYSYGLSRDISSTVRSSPAANYEWNQAIFGNDPALAYSNYDLRHKLIAIHAYRFKIGNSNFNISALYNGRSGSPYSFVYQGDLNNDGSSRNDLVYIPQDQSEITLIDNINVNGERIDADAQWDALDNYISKIGYLNKNRGKYAERNGAKTPWNHQLDMKFEWAKDVFKSNKLTISADLFNVLNVLNRKWGKLYYVPNVVNSSFSLLKLEAIENNVPQYTFDIPQDENPWIVDAFNSRWRLQLGIKLDF